MRLRQHVGVHKGGQLCAYASAMRAVAARGEPLTLSAGRPSRLSSSLISCAVDVSRAGYEQALGVRTLYAASALMPLEGSEYLGIGSVLRR